MITWELAEDAVTVTEQDAVVPDPASVHVAAGLKLSVATEELKDTDPVGQVVAPGVVSVIVAVTVAGCPTTTVPLENPTVAEVERMFTVRFAPPLEGWWVELPG